MGQPDEDVHPRATTSPRTNATWRPGAADAVEQAIVDRPADDEPERSAAWRSTTGTRWSRPGWSPSTRTTTADSRTTQHDVTARRRSAFGKPDFSATVAV